nr:hypothetical protein [Flavobacterium sp. ASV13]
MSSLGIFDCLDVCNFYTFLGYSIQFLLGFWEVFDKVSGAISSHPLYLFLAKEARKKDAASVWAITFVFKRKFIVPKIIYSLRLIT